jgi:hypothetical protein
MATDGTLIEIGKLSAKMIGEQQPLLGSVILGLAALVLFVLAFAIIRVLYKEKSLDRIAGFLFEVQADGKVGKPSVSRLQMLIWNFVVAFAFLYLLGTRANVLAATKALFQTEVLILLGISNGTYILGKRTKQGSAASQPETPAATTPSGGQPVVPGEAMGGGPGPQGTQ